MPLISKIATVVVLLTATLFGLYPFLLKLYADGGYQGAGCCESYAIQDDVPGQTLIRLACA
jgi:hypothetical protein